MYCANFRRSSLGIDNNRNKSNPSDCFNKFDRRLNPKMHGDNDLNHSQQLDGYETFESHLSDRNMCQKIRKHLDQEEHQQHLDEEQIMELTPNIRASDRPINSKRKSNDSITRQMISRFEKQQENDELHNPCTPNRSMYFIARNTEKNATNFEKNLRQTQRKMASQRQHSRLEEKQKDGAHNLLISRVGKSGLLGNQFPSFDETQHQLTHSPTSVINNNTNSDFAISKEISLKSKSFSEQRLMNELKKTSRLLDMERNKNLTLTNKFEDTECQLRAIRKPQSTDLVIEEYARQIRKLQDRITHYQEALTLEKKMRAEAEAELEETRRQNRRCAEQMDMLIFQHIPSVAPVFKDIGPVKYTIEDSFDFVGSYRLGEVLGEGYYGSVRVGSHLSSMQKFAIKILKKTSINRFKDLKQIALEAHVLKTYQHQNIVRLKEVLHTAHNIYMVTELCFMDLHKYHNDVGLSIESARQVVFGILDPIHHLHRHGICHLDLKPENILLTKPLGSHNAKYEHVRICDFGLANMARKPDKNKDIIREGYACGTPGFYAPEMVIQDKFEGRCADMWSLGCIILEITLGFTQEWIDSYNKADDNPETFQKGLKFCLSEISIQQYPGHANLLDLIHACLSIDPLKRITSQDALLHPWLASIEKKLAVGRNVDQLQEERKKELAHAYSDRIALLEGQAGFCA